MRSRGAPIGTSVIIGIGRGILLKHNRSGLEEFGGSLKLNKEWAKCILRRMGYSKRRANAKAKISPSDFKEIKDQFLMDVKSVVKMEDIPDKLVINWDLTAMKIVPSSSWTMEKRGTKKWKYRVLMTSDKLQLYLVAPCLVTSCQFN